jgi:hypothetical protein
MPVKIVRKYYPRFTSRLHAGCHAAIVEHKPTANWGARMFWLDDAIGLVASMPGWERLLWALLVEVSMLAWSEQRVSRVCSRRWFISQTLG